MSTTDPTPPPAAVATGNNDEADEDMTMNNLREKLALMQQIHALSAQISTPGATKPAMRVKVPQGSYNMSPTEYRTYKKDCMSYRTLTHMTDHDVVLQIRMEMDGDLKRIIDTNYPKFEDNSVERALEIVGTIVTAVSSTAVYRHKFNQMSQHKDERIREYETRLRSCSLDCDFVCPYDVNHNLTDYHLINRIRTGIYDSMLQQEILQKHEELHTVELLVAYCENYEATKRDREVIKQDSGESVIASIVVEESEKAF